MFAKLPATPEFVRTAHKILLLRELEEEHVVDAYVSRGMSAEEVVVAIIASAEFSSGEMASRLAECGWSLARGTKNKSMDDLFKVFKKHEGPGTPGFYTDFLGVKTRVNYVPNVEKHDGMVFDYPSRQQQAVANAHEEWEGTLRSVLEAKNRFVAIELGAGWGPWLVTSAAAARQRGIQDIQLAGVEGSEDHFSYLLQHLTDNGIDPAQHFLFKGVIGTHNGFSYFPKLPDPMADWGAQAIMTSESSHAEPKQGERFVDYRGVAFDSMEKVPSLALSTLLQQYHYVDLVHCDIQDSEGEVIPSAIDEFNERVRRVVIGTHSRRSEGALLHAFSAEGWVIETDTPCRYVVANNRVAPVKDGVQVWANPRLKRA